jgi:uncharacterized membrane protein YqjE
MTHADEPRPSIFGLARQLVGGVVQLVRLELAHGRQEIGEMLAETRLGAILFAVAAVFIVIALVTLDIVVVLGVAALFEVLPDLTTAIIILAAFVALTAMYGAFGGFSFATRVPWYATAAMLLVVIGLAAGFALPASLGFRAGWLSALFVFTMQLAVAPLFIMRGVRHMRIGPPERTIESVKEDIAWAKRLLKRG